MSQVSIITASYNYGIYIAETIESVLNQPFQDWELIIVDDGSKDNSIDVIKSYCQKDNRIKLYQHKDKKNKGLAETLKLGIEKSKSEWIVFLESDDTISSNYFEEKFKIIKKNPEVDFIFNDVNMFGDSKIISEYNKTYFSKTKPILNKLKFPTKMFTAFQTSKHDNLIPTFSSVMLKRNLLNNLDFNSPIKPYLDWYLWVQIVNKHNCYFYYTEKKLTNWRMHPKSYISTKLNEKEKFKFEVKKSLLLLDFSNILKTMFNMLLILRRQIIRLHFNDGECFILNKKHNIPLLRSIYSRKKDGNRIQYRILGVKISKKIKNKKQKFNIDKIKNNIKQQILSPTTKYVSFDIFDTLLVRPCIQPTDIFALIAEKVDKKYGIDFISMRQKAESGLYNANIYEIYDSIAYNYNLSEELKNILLKEEIEAETKLLFPREDVKEFYNLALKNNKKIIVISDMYLPSQILKNILSMKGFDNIEKIYVSNEYNARKDNGELFDIVATELNSKEVFHMGDNKNSDYNMPINKNFKAAYYPKVIDILSNSNVLLNNLINESYSNEVEVYNRNIFIGFVLHNYWFKKHNNNLSILNTINDFANLFLAPYLCFLAFSMQRNLIIQNLYKKIFFVARDGYLPNKVYNILNNGKYIPSEYIYGSRVAYWTGTYSSIYDLLTQQKNSFQSDYTLEDFINAYISDKQVQFYLKNKYTQTELKTGIKYNFETSYELLKREHEIFDTYYKNQKQLAEEYYANVFYNENERIVVFDVGYSGSVSRGLSKLTPKIVDKIYIHETTKNIYRDNKYQTCTFVLKNGIESNLYGNLDLLLEECFSPLEGTCCGFKRDANKIVPILDAMNIGTKMKEIHTQLNKATETFAKDLATLFGEYVEYLNITDINPIFKCIDSNFKNNPNEKEIFKDIVFNDTAVMHNQKPLSKKI